MKICDITIQNTPSKKAEQFAINKLYSAGFVDHGHVDLEIVFTESGTPIQLGGRKRYILPGTKFRATVGRVTTLLYSVDGDHVTFISKIPTINKTTVNKTIIDLFSR